MRPAREIYVRPALCPAKAISGWWVDDIDQVTVEDMKAQGLQPAAVVETPIATVRRG